MKTHTLTLTDEQAVWLNYLALLGFECTQGTTSDPRLVSLVKRYFDEIDGTPDSLVGKLQQIYRSNSIPDEFSFDAIEERINRTGTILLPNDDQD